MNDKHVDWQVAEVAGTVIKNFTPVHIEKVSSLTAPAEADLTVTLVLAATNISDDTLPSTVMVGIVPVDIDDNQPATGVDNISIDAVSSDIGYQNKFWIMAPSGNASDGSPCSNAMKFKIPYSSPMEMEHSHPIGWST